MGIGQGLFCLFVCLSVCLFCLFKNKKGGRKEKKRKFKKRKENQRKKRKLKKRKEALSLEMVRLVSLKTFERNFRVVGVNHLQVDTCCAFSTSSESLGMHLTELIASQLQRWSCLAFNKRGLPPTSAPRIPCSAPRGWGPSGH